MNKDFVSYEQAVKLYNLDFDWDCEMAYYVHSWMKEPRLVHFTIAHEVQCDYDGTDVYPAPSLTEAQKWLREVKQIHVYPIMESVNKVVYDCKVVYLRKDAFRLNKHHPSYEQALSAGLDAALELIEKKGE